MAWQQPWQRMVSADGTGTIQAGRHSNFLARLTPRVCAGERFMSMFDDCDDDLLAKQQATVTAPAASTHGSSPPRSSPGTSHEPAADDSDEPGTVGSDCRTTLNNNKCPQNSLYPKLGLLANQHQHPQLLTK